MSDDLVKRLRTTWDADRSIISQTDNWMRERQDAADRIEELEDKLNWVIVERDETFALMLDRAQTAEAKLAKADNLAVAIERRMVDLGGFDNRFGLRKALQEYYGTTLAELKGGKDA